MSIPMNENARLRVKRIYEPVAETDGARVLVDRIWPRGVSREAAHLTLWLKDIAPSTALRKWFGHDPARFAEFSDRYRHELDQNPDAVSKLAMLMRTDAVVTLLYSAHDIQCNQAVALADYMKILGRTDPSG